MLQKKRSKPLQLFYYLILLSFSFSFLACEDSDDVSEGIELFEILSIGDSRVEGHETDFVSYRYDLWKRLKAEDKDVDFLGSRIDERIYPDFQEVSFDINHEGKGGDRADQTLKRLNDLIAENPEMVGNVVLLGVGGNDLIQGESSDTIIRNLNLIIDRLQETNESVTIFIEQIAPGTTDFQESNSMNYSEYVAFNEAISNLAITRTTPQSEVVVVDMSAVLTDEDYADHVHYNESGAQKIADQYFEAMRFLF